MGGAPVPWLEQDSQSNKGVSRVTGDAVCAGCGGCTFMSCSMGVRYFVLHRRRQGQAPGPPALPWVRWGLVHPYPGHGAKPIVVVELLRELLLALVMTSVSKRPYGSPQLTKTKHGSTGALRHQRAGGLSLPWAGGRNAWMTRPNVIVMVMGRKHHDMWRSASCSSPSEDGYDVDGGWSTPLPSSSRERHVPGGVNGSLTGWRRRGAAAVANALRQKRRQLEMDECSIHSRARGRGYWERATAGPGPRTSKCVQYSTY